MTGCHSCETADLIAAGRYKHIPWEEVPCATCEVIAKTSHAMEYDDQKISPEEAKPSHHKPEDEQTDNATLEKMIDAMVAFLQLRPEVRDVIAWRMAGLKYPDIALLQGVTTACVEKRHKTALVSWPALQALFPRKIAKQRIRKPHTRRSAE